MKGLSCLFKLDDKGAFKLTDGVDKARDNILFTCNADKLRVYEPYFGVKLLSLLRSLEQKPISTLQMTQSIIKAQLIESIVRYNPNVEVNDVDLGYVDNDRKHYGVYLDYSVMENGGNKTNDVIFI